MAREFYQRPDRKLILKPQSLKAEVSRAVKEAFVALQKEKQVDIELLASAAERTRDALAKYVRGSPQDDEMDKLREIAALTFATVLDEKSIQDPALVARFNTLVLDRLPPHPLDVSTASRHRTLRHIPPGDAPSLEME